MMSVWAIFYRPNTGIKKLKKETVNENDGFKQKTWVEEITPAIWDCFATFGNDFNWLRRK